MKRLLLIFILSFFISQLTWAQTTFTSLSGGGAWTAGTTWNGGSAPPGVSSNTVVIASDADVTINTNIGITGSGVLAVNGDLIDPPGGTAYTLTISNLGELHVYDTMIIEGAAILDNSGVIHVHGCGVLIVGDLTLNNNSTLIVDSCATLIVNGNMTLNNSNASQIDGNVIVTGNVDANNAATVFGDGSIVAGGSITSDNSSTFFGNSVSDCNNTATPCYAGGGFVGPLPIELLYFKGEPDGDQVNLTWATASEQNNSYFTVERSVDGYTFEVAGYLPTQAVYGNSSTTLNYSMTDNEPFPGLSFYRLKQTDYDNSYEYSEIISVSLSKTNDEVHLYPNPANHDLNLEIDVEISSKTEVQLTIVNMLGQPVLKRSEYFTDGRCKISLPELEAGPYFITITCGQFTLHKNFQISK